jgi:hypothetical protein
MAEIGNLRQQLDDTDNLLVDAVRDYHSPSKFFTYSSSAIQAARNFTFESRMVIEAETSAADISLDDCEIG